VAIYPAKEEEVPEVLAFEDREFPGWAPGFRYMTELEEFANLLVARDLGTGGVVGTLLLFPPACRWLGANIVWKELLGADLGGLGAVGVAASERGRGIGIALVARASEVLRERGTGNCHIDWTGLLDFYGKLGYLPWRQYYMSVRPL